MGVWEHSGKFPTGGAERGSLKELLNDGESPSSSLTHTFWPKALEGTHQAF